MLLKLDPLEFEVVADVLKRAMRELREEIYKTDLAEFKMALKQREAALGAVLQRLTADEASALAVGDPALNRS